MSFIFKEVDNPSHCKPSPLHGKAGIIGVSIDPKTTNQLPFPSDYKYFSSVWPRRFIECAERIKNFKIRADDIWIIGYMKSGTTWMHNIVHQLKNNLNFNDNVVIQPDTNYFEGPALLDPIDGDEEFKIRARRFNGYIDALDALPSPRLIKSHLPAFLLPHEVWTLKPKLIYMSRDARDVAVSCYHMMKNSVIKYQGSTNDYYHAFYNDYIIAGPFYEHIHSYVQLRHLDHLLFMTYEHLLADTFANTKRVCDFLNCSYNDEQISQLVDFVSFGKLRDRVDIFRNGADPNFRFCRKGKIGGYRDDMTEEDVKKFDEWKVRKFKELNVNESSYF